MSEYFQLDYNSIKEILHDCSKTLDSSNNYVGTDDLIIQFIDNLLQENQKYKEVIDKANKYINDNLIISSILDGKKYYTLNNYSFDYRELLEILDDKEVE